MNLKVSSQIRQTGLNQGKTEAHIPHKMAIITSHISQASYPFKALMSVGTSLHLLFSEIADKTDWSLCFGLSVSSVLYSQEIFVITLVCSLPL